VFAVSGAGEDEGDGDGDALTCGDGEAAGAGDAEVIAAPTRVTGALNFIVRGGKQVVSLHAWNRILTFTCWAPAGASAATAIGRVKVTLPSCVSVLI
jgi:hypothetical protein